MAATKRSPIHKNVARFRSGTGRWLSVCLWFSLSHWVSAEWVSFSHRSAVVCRWCASWELYHNACV